MTKYEVEEKTVEYLKTVFDPEIPVNVWDLGMIYKIDVKETAEPADGKDFDVDIDMTFTAPNCPAADFILEDIQQKLEQGHDERRSKTRLRIYVRGERYEVRGEN